MERRVRFRATDGQIAGQAVSMELAWLVLAAMFARMGLSTGSLALVAVLAAANLGLLVAVLRWRGLELTPATAVVRDDRRREIAWGDVRGVRVQRRFGTARVVLDTDRGPRACPAPVAGLLSPDRHFDAKATYIWQWWSTMVPPGTVVTGPTVGWAVPAVRPPVGR